MMRSYVDEKQNPLLWASTYHAGECLDPVAVAKAKAKRKAKKLAVSHTMIKEETSDGALNQKLERRSHDLVLGTELIGKKQMAIEGFKAQSEMVIDSLDRLITAWEERKESVVVEGVHLSLNFVLKEEIFVSGSEEEEADYPPDGDSDEDLSDMDHKEIHDEVEGSVDEDSTKSDEEYDDLAMRDGLENGYWSDDDCPESTNTKRIADDEEPIHEGDGVAADEYQHNLKHIFKRSDGVVEPPLPCTLPREINKTCTGQRTRRRSLSDSMRLQYRTQSTPAATDELRALQKDPVLAVATQYGPMASC
ncbi:hypothetical protein BHM03_00047701 [Ensete ventricosum]|uniref:Uncharacterized protein n=1 Tax=Ensete ventricosum TaxID=4639 RepID=A0A445ML64_ENSVE|nr:hypothetical protein BHM03_00047701 [Ensete ventricosum]